MALIVTHVIPLDDEREHSEVADCWCHPTAEHDEGTVHFVHNSADLREEYERITGDSLPGKQWVCVKLSWSSDLENGEFHREFL